MRRLANTSHSVGKCGSIGNVVGNSIIMNIFKNFFACLFAERNITMTLF
jgi:hypothetical protein